jgi:hypothetical protein
VNIDTGHLMMLKENQSPPDGYEPVPKKLNEEVREALNGSNEIYIDLNQKSKSSWAREKKKAKNKIAKQSRKKNRR